MKLKLLFVSSSLIQAGPVVVLLNILSKINFEEFDVTLLALKKINSNSLECEFTKYPIKILYLSDLHLSRVFGFYKYISIVKELSPDIIHSHCVRSLLLSAFFLKSKIKLVYTLHIYPGYQTICINGLIKGTLLNFISKYILSKYRYIVCCSKSLSNELYDKAKIESYTIPNGISTTVHLISRDEVREQLGLSLNTIYYLYVGRLSKEKNVEFLVRNFTKLSIPNSHLLILGDGPEFANLNLIAKDNVSLLGFKSNIRDYYYACDICMSASRVEGLPMSLLEAISSDMPLLVSNIPPHKELIDDGFGYSFELDDDKAFCELLITNNLNKLKVLATNSRSVFREKYTNDVMSKKYQELYKNIQ